MKPEHEQILSEIWSRRVAWSQAANRQNRRINLARTASLTLGGAGAVFAAMAATAGVDWTSLRATSSGGSAACIAAATFITTQFLSTDLIGRWTRSRATSEAIKSEVFVFRATADPYRGAGSDVLLQRNVRAIESSTQDIGNFRAQGDAQTPPPPLDPDLYIALRVRSQIDEYYRPKARIYLRRLSLLRSAQTALNVLGVMTGGLVAYFSGRQGNSSVGGAAWIAVFTTIAASLSAHQAAARYEYLVTSFNTTAARLDALLDEWRLQTSTDPALWSAFVKDCETAILAENGGWMAKWVSTQFQK